MYHFSQQAAGANNTSTQIIHLDCEILVGILGANLQVYTQQP